MSMQDLKACRDYVLNLQDEKNLQMVRLSYEFTASMMLDKVYLEGSP